MGRKTNKIESNYTFFLIVEGKTEKIYFDDMKATEKLIGITIKLQMGKNSSVYSILKTSIEEAKKHIYDSVWCVFDRDNIENTEDIDKLLAQAKRYGVCIADSLPSFEVWFLLHYTVPKLFYKDQFSLIAELKKYINSYEKTARVYSSLRKLLQKAIDNSKILEERGSDSSNSTFCNVYKLIEAIEKHSKNERFFLNL